jgi:PAS domain S-box-containing protein
MIAVTSRLLTTSTTVFTTVPEKRGGDAVLTFGQRLRELRKAKGISQRELARKASISFAYISRLESGLRPPPGEKAILALAQALGADDGDMDELFGLAGKMPSDLAQRIDAGMIRIVRIFGHGLEAPARGTAEIEASRTPDTRLNEQLDRQGDTFRALVEDSPDSIVILGKDLEVLYVNPSTTRIMGYERDEYVGRDTLSAIHPDDLPKAARWIAKVYQTPGDTSSHEQLRVRHKDSTWRLFDVVGKNMLQDPSVKGMIVVMHEVSKRAQHERTSAEDSASEAMAKEYHLTRSEHLVLTLLAQGWSNSRIAEELVVSTSTVRFHVTGILHKLGVTSRTEAAAIAVRRHLVA